jgi:hypothetical protein
MSKIHSRKRAGSAGAGLSRPPDPRSGGVRMGRMLLRDRQASSLNGLARPLLAEAGVAQGSLVRAAQLSCWSPRRGVERWRLPPSATEAVMPKRPLLNTRALVIVLLAIFCGTSVANAEGVAAGMVVGIGVAAVLHGIVA